MGATTNILLLIGAVVLGCYQETRALQISSEIDFEDFIPRVGSPVACPVTSKVCRKRGGYCVEAGTCDTVDIPVFCSKSGHCTCCAKDMMKICKPRKPCKGGAGFCVVNPRACPGGKLIKKGCKCKSHSGRGYCCIPPVSETHWTYTGVTGVDQWAAMFPEHCAGDAQSPIYFDDDMLNNAQFKNYRDEPWVFTGYDVPGNTITLKNNGHSVSISYNSVTTPTVSGGYLGAEYTLAGFHFHWGSDSSKGSEHIFGIQYPLELHLVHFKSDYGDVATALGHPDGLAVLGIFFSTSDTPNENLTPIIDALAFITEPGLPETIVPFDALESLLPETLSGFVRYQGSLTTPTCNEVVTWTVFLDKLPVSDDQMAAFRSLKFDDGTNMVDNFRPVQPLGDRKLTVVD